MARNKYLPKKNRLIKAMRRGETVPAWVLVKTKTKFRFNPFRRYLNRGKLKV